MGEVAAHSAMQAENEATGRARFNPADVSAIQVWSDRLIHEIEARTGFVLAGGEITMRSLPRCATMGLKLGAPAWANNHPRPRGITHVVQVVRRPGDDAPFVSESIGSAVAPGVRLTALETWLACSEAHLRAREIWAVDPFLLAAKT
ncbi:hypothetical protein [Paraburkholderia acidisoli]|uniref:Uncharacterized protein n=1 Tax=Paraburkholderia acidisoli TaxID=2571748 RepID=A0A7Z2GNZ5_9BURK|nr:hypothetical protein [Paraburkholderia acidisoli]QGZ65295.1 hypothetical protein FAZ98_26360 [Paraburkholderia acidisoli]